MQVNVGSADRAIRILAGLSMLAAGLYFQNYWGALGLVPLTTGALGRCPPYTLLGINTCSLKQADEL